MAYATKDDIIAIFGEENVNKWANIDNLPDGAPLTAHIIARCAWALALAAAKIDDTLDGCDYTIPFTATYPLQIVDANARLAGVLLYDSRGIVDADEAGNAIHALKPHEDKVRALLQQIKSGKIRLRGVARLDNAPVNLTGTDAYPVVRRDYDYPIIGPPYWDWSW